MKDSNIQYAILGIDEKYLDKSFDFEGISSSFKKERSKRISSVCTFCFMAICLTALGINQIGMFSGKDPAIFEEGVTNASEIYLEPAWEDRAITEKFPAITFNNIEYNCTINNGKSLPINQNADKKIGKQTISVIDYTTGKEHSINAILYSLKDISSDCIIALKFEGYEGLYTFVNTGYEISTLQDLITALSLNDTLTFDDIEYSDINDPTLKTIYTIKSQTNIWQYLFLNTNVRDLGDIDINPMFNITVNISSLGIYNKSLIVSEDGYIQTNILEVAHTFYVGKESVNAFKNYIMTLPSKSISVNPVDTETEFLE